MSHDSPELDAAAVEIQSQLDQLALRTRDMTSTTAEAVMVDAISTIARCVALKRRFVSFDALARAVELETRANRIVERCRVVRGAKR